MRSLIDLVGRRRPAHTAEAAGTDPAGEEPAREEPAGEEPIRTEPGADEPAREESAGEEPARTEPGADEPAREEPAAEEPVRRESAGKETDRSEHGPGESGEGGPGGDESAEDAPEEGRFPASSPADRTGDDRAEAEAAAGGAKSASEPRAELPAAAATETAGDPGRRTAEGGAGTRRRRFRRLPVVLGVVTVLLGGTAAWCADEAKGVRDASGGGNVALTDVATTSDVKGVVTDAVNTIFSFDYADMARTEQAAGNVLTGDAVRQYDAMVAQVRAQAPAQKLVLTTTVTDSAVEMLQGGRARLLLFADQRSTRTVAKDTTYAAAMLAVDAVRRDGHWKISAIDTLTGRR